LARLIDCPSCGHAVDAGARMCPICGHPKPGAMGVVPAFFLRAIAVIGILLVAILVLATYARPQFEALMNVAATVWGRVGF
jgi:zinc-ribbon domain